MADNSSNEHDPKKLQRQAELRISERFMQVFQKRLDLLRTTQESNFKLEPAERAVLMEINNFGLLEGSLAGVITLIGLRRWRYTMWQRLYRKTTTLAAKKGQLPWQDGGHVHNSPFGQQKGGTGPPMGHGGSGGAATNVARPSTLYQVFGWTLDLLGSFSVAVGTSLLFTNQHKILTKLAHIPLTPGHSKVSANFCPDVLDTLQQLRREAVSDLDRHALEQPQSEYLQALLTFAENCQRRRVMEQRLRMDKGVRSAEFPVSIPEPGVPVDFDITMYDENEQENNDDFYDPQQEEYQEWADDVTNDQGSKDDKKSDRRWGFW